MSAVPSNDSKAQFNVTVSPDLKRRLEELAVRFKKGKATKVGADIIETYIERWVELEVFKEQLKDAQAKEMADDIRQHLTRRRPPLMQTEPSRAVRPGRKTKQ